MSTMQMLNYLSQLEQHNTREWFHAQEGEYKAAELAFLELLCRLTAELGRQDARFAQNPPRQMMLKLMRDTRFTADKSPYTPAFRAQISPVPKQPFPLGYFFTVRPGDRSFLGGGLCTAAFSEATDKIRRHIAANGGTWQRLLSAPDFVRLITLKGEKLKNVPRGYDSLHPQGEYLKYKDWQMVCPVADAQLANVEGFAAFAAQVFSAMRPLNAFLNEALQEMPPPKKRR